MNCPLCDGKNLSILRIDDYNINIKNNGDIESDDYEQNIYCSGVVFCRDCSEDLVFDVKNKKWRKAKEQEIIEAGINFFENGCNMTITPELLKKIKRILIMRGLK
jgi:hypothetical protein